MLTDAARTGKIGDGKVFTYDIGEANPHPQRRAGRGGALNWGGTPPTPQISGLERNIFFF